MDRRRLMLHQGRLPSEYQEVAWIASASGRPYIDTLYAYNTGDTIYCKYLFGFENSSIPDSGAWVFGALDPGDDVGWRRCRVGSLRSISGLYFQVAVNGSWSNTPSNQFVSNQIYEFTGQFTRDLERSIWLLGGNQRGETGGNEIAGLRIYAWKVVGKIDMIPCFRVSDGEIGMYDLYGSICPLTNTPFYTNAGTGTFTKGEDVN